MSVERDDLLGIAAAENFRESGTGCLACHCERTLNSRKRRCEVSCIVCTVKTGNDNVIGHSVAELFQRGNCGKSHCIVCADESVGQFHSRKRELLDSGLSVLLTECSVVDSARVDPQAVFVHDFSESVVTRESLRVCKRA